MGRKVHGQGGSKGHYAKEFAKSWQNANRTNALITRKRQARQKKINAKLVHVIKGLGAQETLKQWARKEMLGAKRQLEKKAIRPFTFYCKLLAADAVFSERWPKQQIKVRKGFVYSPAESQLLGKTQKSDIFEKLNEIGATTAAIKKEVAKQEKNLKKSLPKTIRE